MQEFRDYLGNVVHSSEEDRLNAKKALLDNRAERLNREYAEYNGEVARYYQRAQSGLLLPNPVFTPVPNAPAGNNGAALPTTQQFAPAQHYAPTHYAPTHYAPMQYAPQPVMFDAPNAQQPAQANLVPRERSLLVNPRGPVFAPGFGM